MKDAPELAETLKERLETHKSAVAGLRDLANRLDGLEATPRAAAQEAFDRALDSARSLRQALTTASEVLEREESWQGGSAAELEGLCARTAEELAALVGTLSARRVEALRTQVEAGAIEGLSDWRHRKAAKQRERLLSALGARLDDDQGTRTAFPGPDKPESEPWLQWFWALEYDEEGEVAEELERSWSAVLDFLTCVQPEHWRDGSSLSSEAPQSDPAPDPDPAVLDDDSASAEGQNEEPGIDIGEAAGTPATPATSGSSATTTGAEPEVGVEPGPEPEPEREPEAKVETEPQTRGDEEAETEVAAPIGAPAAAAPAPPPPADTVPPETSPAEAESAEPGSGADSSEPDEDLDDDWEDNEEDPDDTSLNVPVSEHPPDLQPVDVPVALTLPEYEDRFWLGSDGETAEEAPWLDRDAFAARIAAEQARVLFAESWAVARLLGAAGEALRADAVASVDLVDALARLPGGLEVGDAAIAPAKEAVLRHIGAAEVLTEHPARWGAALLTLLGPAASHLTDEQISSVCTLLDLGSQASRLVGDWVAMARADMAVSKLRDQLSAEAKGSSEDLGEALLAARETLHEDIKLLTKAAGGAIERTHCRDAWDAWMSEALPELQRMAAGAEAEGVGARLSRLERRAKKIFDRGGAKFQDRKKMDKAVDRLLDRGRAIAAIRVKLEEADDLATRTDYGLRYQDDVIEYVRNGEGASPLEKAILAAIRARLEGRRKSTEPWSIPAKRVRRRPALVEGWDDYDPEEPVLDTRRVQRPAVASAHLLAEPLANSVEDLTTWLAKHRPDLIPARLKLGPRVARALREHRREVNDRLQTLSGRLRRASMALDELADEQAKLARSALDSVEQREGEPPSALVERWVRHVTETLESRVEARSHNLLIQALKADVPYGDAKAMVDAGRRGALLRRLSDGPVLQTQHGVRATAFRDDARKLWPYPARALRNLPTAPSGKSTLRHDVVGRWMRIRKVMKTRGPRASEANDWWDLFAEFVLRTKEASRVTRVKTYKPKGRLPYVSVEMTDVRNWLVEDTGERLTFLPQLRRFRSLALVLPPVEVGAGYLASKIRPEAEQGVLTVVLAPGLTEPARDKLFERLRAGTRPPIAVLDDLDLCRLLNPEKGEAPPPLLGLLEIVAEQQDWDRFKPYEVVEGQHVRLEMFVGRQREAEALAREATYSRIFSGRRLGKTALLRFVQGNPEFEQLPSRNRLEVVFVPIPGMESERKVVDAIIENVAKHLGRAQPAPPHGASPVEKLDAAIKEFVGDDGKLSLLILLDEADTFFEAQVAADTAGNEQTLSWWMSRVAQQERDSMGLPLVRFVVCGYRRTDQYAGVWANWGDVLFLRPLEVDDAVRLVLGPLARIGIDASAQADNIAFRCGYQPAVIIRFGVELLQHLVRSRPRQAREAAEVTAEDVVAVFRSNQVQSAIRETSWLNFVGHPMGQLIFATLLMELRERPPASVIEDAPDVLLERVRECEPSFDPATLKAGPWSDLVHQQLRELVDRSLLVSAGYNPASYRLRFPHHLQVLLQEDPAQRVRDSIARLGREGRRPDWILPEPVVESARYAVSEEARDMGVRAVAVCTHWPEPLLDRERGLAPRIGIRNQEDAARPTGADTLENALVSDDGVPPGKVQLRIGGINLARAAIELAAEDGSVELARTGRLELENIAAHLQRKRAAEFPAGGMARIMEVTGGIPLLVKTFDEILAKEFDDAPTLDEQGMGRVLSLFSERLQDVKSQLAGDDPTIALTQREAELIRMVALASEQYDYDDMFRDALRDQLVVWPVGFAPEPFGPADRPALRALLCMGLLPRAAERTGAPLDEVAPLRSSDPALSLID